MDPKHRVTKRKWNTPQDIPDFSKLRLVAGTIKNPEQMKMARAYVSDLKLAGRELGREIKRDKEKSLEQKVSSVIAIGGFLGSIFFLSSGFSKNIQLSPEMLSPSSINWNLWIGLGLLLIGIIGAVFWFKKRK